ncbi:rab-GTPase-TBC domain-containing protein [Lactifluus subvellereus]|nr:rab-GTPase-TBC domain-containing protein [Lactifluus subvellereus]
MAIPSSLDWDTLRLQSLATGGFGTDRAYIWPKLLHVDVNDVPIEFQKELDPHQDERQIRLDTDRSFVLYPVDDGEGDDRLTRQAELNNLIVQVFRRHPGLNYFQGFHDIATVLQLTLPPKVALPALEKLSLHRLRDSMGHTLDPLTGLMLILQRLLQLADPPYATLLDEHAPLPYAALPHLLTLFAHAAPTLPLIQHIFDYLLVRPPLAIVYLVAAMILSRKDYVSSLGKGGDDGMIHSVLTGLPEFSDYNKDQNDDQGYEALPDPEPSAIVVEHSNQTAFPKDVADAPLICKGSESECNISGADLHIGEVLSAAPTYTLPPDDESTPGVPFVPRAVPQPGAPTSFDPSDIPLPPSAASTRAASPTRAGSPRSPSAYSLLSVFLLADELFARFPPTTPELRLTRTLGPASAMRTWAQDVALLPGDDQAEALVVAAVDIVIHEELEPDPRSQKEIRQRAKKSSVMKGRRGDAKLLIAGAVLVLGVAVAFGVNARHGGGVGRGREAEWHAVFGAFGALGERMMGLFDDAQLWL